jgi:hypothetical protein
MGVGHDDQGKGYRLTESPRQKEFVAAAEPARTSGWRLHNAAIFGFAHGDALWEQCGDEDD